MFGKARLVAFKTSWTGERCSATEFARPIAAVPHKQLVNAQREHCRSTRSDAGQSAEAGSGVFVVLQQSRKDG